LIWVQPPLRANKRTTFAGNRTTETVTQA